jgi:hypothetical protein
MYNKPKSNNCIYICCNYIKDIYNYYTTIEDNEIFVSTNMINHVIVEDIEYDDFDSDEYYSDLVPKKKYIHKINNITENIKKINNIDNNLENNNIDIEENINTIKKNTYNMENNTIDIENNNLEKNINTIEEKNTNTIEDNTIDIKNNNIDSEKNNNIIEEKNISNFDNNLIYNYIDFNEDDDFILVSK